MKDLRESTRLVGLAGSDVGQDQGIKGEELAKDRVVGGFHFIHGSEEMGFALVQEQHAIGEALSESHVVGNDNAGQAQLVFELLYEVAENAGD
jgi:hypothetical protein